MIKDSYINIQSWMVTELGLKGNDLLIYAIIYGFSQDGETKYKGGLNYLAEWCGSSKQGVQKNLKNLVEKRLINKHETYVNNIKFCEYSCNFDTISELHGMKHSCIGYTTELHGGIQLSCTNNINNNLNNNKNNIYSRDVESIVFHLNKKANTNYRSSTSKTRQLIESRLKEGFKLEDFYTVIDKKCYEWIGTDYEKFLRPETLFGNKFEGYLNQPIKAKKKSNGDLLNSLIMEDFNDEEGSSEDHQDDFIGLPY